jgi:3-deoxy-D-manno-octulosonic-acid transferase
LYNSCFPFALAAMLPGLAARMVRRGGYREGFAQRFGRFDPALRAPLSAQPRLWLQSVSVGETLLALKLADALAALRPDLRVALSATTSTGYAVAGARPREGLTPIYNPIDATPFVRRTLDLLRPAHFVAVEAVWPNLAALAKQRGADLTLVARLSPRSEARFRRFRAWTGPVFRLFDRILVQSPDDIPRWESLGADPARVIPVGGIKFDQPDAAAPSLDPLRPLLARVGPAPDGPVLLGGSTFPGEEEALGRTLLQLRAEHPRLRLVVVPRHAERAGEAAAALERLGLRVARRSAPSTDPADVLLVDVTGELAAWYHLADVAFIGKSLATGGGQNPAEAAAAGIPILFGPRMDNFEALARLLESCGAAETVSGETALAEACGKLLADPATRAERGRRGREALAPHRGAAARAAAAILGATA